MAHCWHKVYFFSLFTVTFTLFGCATNLYHQNLPERLDDAASVHVAVLSVAPWREYREAMQPVFDMKTADDALSMVLPSTLTLEETLKDSFSASLQAGMPSTSSTGSASKKSVSSGSSATKEAATAAGASDKSTATQAGKTTAASDKSTATQAGKTTAASEKSTADENAAKAEGTQDKSKTPSAQSSSLDPWLRYLAATALYQEVQVLNRYIKDAAIHEYYSPYLVRLQVSLMPRMQDEPYDAYSNISFFPGEFDVPARFNLSSMRDPYKGIRVLPLLVTDDIEMAIHEHSLDQTRQFALTLSALFHGVSAGADLKSSTDSLRKALGHDFNSTFTVARVSDNTIRCRFGAQYQSNSMYAMVPQTHNVTLVVLVPNENTKGNFRERTVHLISKTTLTNTQTGKDLQSRTHNETMAETRRSLAGISDQDANVLNGCILSNDWDRFNSECQRMNVPLSLPREYLWADLTDVRLGSSYSNTSFVVPLDPEADRIWASQTPILTDDGKDSSTVKLRSVVGLEADKLLFTLAIPAKGSGKVLAHTGATVGSDGKTVDITFPSLAACKLAQKGKPPAGGISLCVIDPLQSPQSNHKNEGVLFQSECSYVYKPPESAKAQPKQPAKPGEGGKPKKPEKSLYEVSAKATTIDADQDGNGKVSIVCSGPAEKMDITLSIQGAVLKIPGTGGSPAVTTKDFSVSSPGTLDLELSKLDPEQNVTILAKDAKNEKIATIELKVKSVAKAD
jgi:hypothetical protein